MPKIRYWSDTAQHEFAALFEDADHAPAFVEKVADALIRGWPPNRDKPLWALALVIEALGRASARPNGLEILARSPAEVLADLTGAAAAGVPGIALAGGSRAVRLEADGATIVLGRARIGILRKIAEFLVAADGYAHSAAILAIFLDLAANPSTDGLKDGVRALSRRLYEYRKTHFAEGHAASGFDYVRRRIGHGTPTDDDVLALWTAPDNTHFGTYRTAFLSALSFLAMRRAVTERAAVGAAGSIDDPANDRGTPEAEDGGVPSPLALAAAFEEDGAPPLAALKTTDLNVFTKAEVDFAELLDGVWPAGRPLVRSVMRLLAFHPIQSGLSNALRTGRSKVPAEQRVTCVEAASYLDNRARLDGLHEKTGGWLAVLYSLTVDEPPDREAARVSARGEALLSRSRSKSFDRPEDELTALFREIAPSLVALAHTTDDAREAMTAWGGLGEERMRDAFEADRAVFAAEFARRYLGRSPHAEGPGHDEGRGA